MAPHVLIVDDLDSAREMLARSLAHRYRVSAWASVPAAVASLERGRPDVIVSDLRMPGVDGIAGLAAFAEKAPGVPVILLTAFGTVGSAVQAMKAGAFDYLPKPCDPEELEVVIERALEHRNLRAENHRLREQLREAFGASGIVGDSPAMRALVSVIERVAPSPAPILIEGESGTGKDLVARAIHAMSDRASGPYLALNVAAIPESLAEAELFGHEKGAFSGAGESRRGFFAEAEGGTLFLDEIAALPASLQPKLLRVLQSGDYFPVGARRPRQAAVRVVCASNQSLEEAVAGGRFREDLYYRICVVPVHLPPLRERKEDLPLLVEHLLTKQARALGRPVRRPAPQTLQALLDHDWPGNVRELENVLERALLLAQGSTILPCDLPPGLRGGAGSCPGDPTSYRDARDLWEAEYLSELLRRAGGSVTRAAELSGLHRSTLYEKLGRHALVGQDPSAPR